MSALSDALNEANVNGWSAREIARRSSDAVHFGTVAKYLKGTHGHPSEDVLQVFSQVLNVPMPRLRELAGLPAGEQSRYVPPREADRLDRRQRRVIDELIRMLADTTTKAGDGDDRDAAPIGASAEYDYAVRTPTGHLQLIELKTGSGKTENLLRTLEQMQRQVPAGYQVITVAMGELSGPRIDWDEFLADVVEDQAARPSTTE